MKKRRLKWILFLCFLAAVLWIGYTSTVRVFPIKYTELILNYAEKYHVEPELIAAVIKVESDYREKVVSNKSAVGLMQLTEPTLFWLFSKTPEKEEFGAERLVEPEISIKYGTLNLSLLLNRYKTETEALAAYNAGRTSVDNWLSDDRYTRDGETLADIPYPETANFVRKVSVSKTAYTILYKLKRIGG